MLLHILPENMSFREMKDLVKNNKYFGFKKQRSQHRIVKVQKTVVHLGQAATIPD